LLQSNIDPGNSISRLTAPVARLIYRHIDQQVVIYVIADGRRDMQSLLSRRVLSA